MTEIHHPAPLFTQAPPGCICHKCPKVKGPMDICGLCPVHGVRSELPR